MDKLFENLTPYEYKYNTLVDGLETEKLTLGVMVQDIAKGIKLSGKDPKDYSIITEQSNGYYTVDYIQLIPILIKEIKILQTKVEQLEKDKP